MKKNRLILKELEDSLIFWEDLFLLVRLSQKAVISKDFNLKAVMSAFRILPDLKKIKQPEQFRAQLYGKEDINPIRFLPPPPEDAGWLTPIDYARTAPIDAGSLVFYPYAIANWLKTKKVFQVDPGIIPLVNPAKVSIRDLFSRKHFLSLLPCDSFVIYFTQPLEIELESLPIIKRYKCCIVVRTGNLVDTFWIPDDVEIKSLQQDDRDFIEKLIKNKHVREREIRRLNALAERMSMGDDIRIKPTEEGPLQITTEPVYFTLMSFHIDQPYSFMMSVGDQDGQCVKIYKNIFGLNPSLYEEKNGKIKKRLNLLIPSTQLEAIQIKERLRFERFFFEFINGFCYALSEIKPRVTEPIENGKEGEGNDFSLRIPWNEIPMTRIEYLSEEGKGEKLKISYGSGEKSPHIRRGHWRHLIKKDGTTQKIWIEQVTVRADKLEKGEELKGSVTTIRQKRIA
ncbi:MAG: hypothetical protein KBC17_01350 [Candidatus Pacebacteria bacterium]|nr:hypothetical protein [Candidatus Paceibacterota bacterium]